MRFKNLNRLSTCPTSHRSSILTTRSSITKLALAALAFAPLASRTLAQPLPPVPVPTENPITEAKRLLGKALFWDEQLSADNTMACATCHQMNAGGGDARRAQHPGPNGLFTTGPNTGDDVFASPGVIKNDAFRNYVRDVSFGVSRQVTPRTSMSPINAAYFTTLFWDGRATSQFIDPDTNQVAIASGGALESQIIGPPLSSVEMGHDSINWTEVTEKLKTARPLALATNLTADLATGLSGISSYPQLFTNAFGDSAITPKRIAFAIATYERTLIANQTPFDLNNLTANQQLGLNRLTQNNCTVCHGGPMFSAAAAPNPGANAFRNIGLRPPTEDPGRQAITGIANDLGRMKVASLRNVALKNNFMHNGVLTTLNGVFAFYDRDPNVPNTPPQNPTNLDPVFNPPGNVRMPPPDRGPVTDFLTNALVDPRVRNSAFPFDQPTLYTQRTAAQPLVINSGVAGTGGNVPVLIALDPAFLGNTDFRIGLDRALGSAQARLLVSKSAPVAPATDLLSTGQAFPVTFTTATAPGTGVATFHWPLKAPAVAENTPLYIQWAVTDPAAPLGIALSPVVRITPFCGSVGCTTSCIGDYDNNSRIEVQDILSYVTAWLNSDLRAEVNGKDSLGVQDILDFITAWLNGC